MLSIVCHAGWPGVGFPDPQNESALNDAASAPGAGSSDLEKLFKTWGSTLSQISSWATGRQQCGSAQVQGRDVIADYLSYNLFQGAG